METTKTDVRDRIKTLEDAYADRGVTMEEKRPYAEPKDDFQEALNAVADAFVFVEALNEGKDPYEKKGAYKCWPVFNMYDANDPSGFGFSHVVLVWSHSASSVGARLSFNDDDIAEYAGRTFTSTYQKFMKLQPKQK
jgi:hypothetical protein